MTSPSASSRCAWSRNRIGCGPCPRILASTRLSGHSEKTTIAVVTTATTHQPAPTAIPTAAVAHRLAAVVSPRTDVPYLMIAPAPRKPMPVTIWAATREVSVETPCPLGKP